MFNLVCFLNVCFFNVKRKSKTRKLSGADTVCNIYESTPLPTLRIVIVGYCSISTNARIVSSFPEYYTERDPATNNRML